MDLHVELAQLIDEARAHGHMSVDCHALDLLLRRHRERHDLDLLAGDQLTRVDL